MIKVWHSSGGCISNILYLTLQFGELGLALFIWFSGNMKKNVSHGEHFLSSKVLGSLGYVFSTHMTSLSWYRGGGSIVPTAGWGSALRPEEICGVLCTLLWFYLPLVLSSLSDRTGPGKAVTSTLGGPTCIRAASLAAPSVQVSLGWHTA